MHGKVFSDYDSNDYRRRPDDDISFSLDRTNESVSVKKKGNSCILGPLQFYCDYYNANRGGYTVKVYGSSGAINNSLVSFCDANGNPKNKVSGTGSKTFYLKLPASVCEDGISKIELSATKWGKSYWRFDMYRYPPKSVPTVKSRFP